MVRTVDRQSADDVHWQIAQGWEDVLLGPDGKTMTAGVRPVAPPRQ